MNTCSQFDFFQAEICWRYIWKVFLQNQPNLTFSFCLNNSCEIGEKMLPVFLWNRELFDSAFIQRITDFTEKNSSIDQKKNPSLFN